LKENFDDSSVIMTSDPTADAVKNELKKKGVEYPFVVHFKTGTIEVYDIFAWVDPGDIDHVIYNTEEQRLESSESEEEAESAFEKRRVLMLSTVHAIAHSYECLHKICHEKLVRDVKESVVDDVDNSFKKFKRIRTNILLSIKKAKTDKELDEQEEIIRKYIEEIKRLLKLIFIPDGFMPHTHCDCVAVLEKLLKERDDRIAKLEKDLEDQKKQPGPGPSPISHSDPDPELIRQLSELKEKLSNVEKERDSFKKQAEELEAKLKKTGEEKILPLQPRLPDVKDKSYVFKQVPESGDDLIYMCQDREYQFAYFYLEKEFLKKELAKNGKQLPKEITCVIRELDPHCSSELEKPLTALYHVRLGVDFYLCTGDLTL